MAGRPRQPSTATIRRIYAMLELGPFSASDWKLFGIGSYSTLHKALRYLEKHDLICSKREGHKKMYFLNSEKSMLDWMPLLTTKRELERLGRIDADTKKIVDQLKDGLRDRFRAVGRYVTLSDSDKKIEEIDLTPRELSVLIEEAEPGRNIEFYLMTLKQIFSLAKCPECLVKKKRLVDTKTDVSTGEVICKECGLIISKDEVQRVTNSWSGKMEDFFPFR